MNVEAITQPSDLTETGQARNAEAAEGSSGFAEFSSTLREAIGEEDASDGDGARAESDSSADSEETSDQQFAEADSEGGTGAEETESTAEELTAEAAIAAAEAGELGAQLPALPVTGREGVGLADETESEGTTSALDSNRRQALSGRATPAVEEDSATETRSQNAGAPKVDREASVEGKEQAAASIAENAQRGTNAAEDSLKDLEGREGMSESASASASRSRADGEDVQERRFGTPVEGTGAETTGEGTETNRGRAGEISSASAVSSETPTSRQDDPSLTGATETSGDDDSQRERDASNASRDFSEEQASGEDRQRQRQSFSEGQNQAENSGELAAEAAAAYATAPGNLRVDEGVPVEGGIAVSGPVAVNAPETASAPTAPTANAPQPAAASDAIAVQTEWLATRGGGSARLTLHPAELGEIEIRVNLRGGVVDVVMVAQEAVTQALAEDQSERLSQAFAHRDLRMENFDVRRGDAVGSSDITSEEFTQSSQEGQDRNERNAQTRSGRGSREAGQVGGSEAQGAPVMPMPQIIATGPEASVDLRI